jgi:hypothetical protein
MQAVECGKVCGERIAGQIFLEPSGIMKLLQVNLQVKLPEIQTGENMKRNILSELKDF